MAENMTNTTANEESVMTKDIFKKTFWRSFPLQACFCYERMQNVGFAYQMVPALKKLYPDKKEASEALKRHLAIFNTTPAIVSFITGAAIAMEEKFKKAKDAGEECDEESINAVKAALMGPLAGIGDSFFWGTFRIIGAGIGASLAAQGSILGAILFLLIYNIPWCKFPGGPVSGRRNCSVNRGRKDSGSGGSWFYGSVHGITFHTAGIYNFRCRNCSAGYL